MLPIWFCTIVQVQNTSAGDERQRPARDLLRRRGYFKRSRAELLTHVQNTVTQYNLPPLRKKLAYKANRGGVAEHFPDEHVRRSIEANLALLDDYDEFISRLELHLERTAKTHDAHTFYLLKTVPGIGKILGLTPLYEIYSIERFPRVQDFLSYCRLVRPTKTSVGKPSGGASGKKIGNAHLRWAFSEAVAGLLRDSEEVKRPEGTPREEIWRGTRPLYPGRAPRPKPLPHAPQKRTLRYEALFGPGRDDSRPDEYGPAEMSPTHN
jgi:transposase